MKQTTLEKAFIQTRRRVQQLDVFALQAFYEGLFAFKAKFEEENRKQLYAGLYVNGMKITPPYKSSTIAKKRRKGQPYNRVTLKDTGKFHNSIVFEPKQKEKKVYFYTKINAPDKRIFLFAKYQRNVKNQLLGIAEERRNALFIKMIPLVNQKLFRLIFGK